MTTSAIEALYIFNRHTNESVLDHVYCGRPASSRSLLPLYLSHEAPRPSVLYLPEANPSTTLFSTHHANLLIFVPASREVEPLVVLEFLHRLIDILEEFVGAPLLASKIENNYDVVAQLLGEMCDAGNIYTTESNALRDVVNTPGFIDNLLGGLGLPGSAPSASSSSSLQQQLRRPVATGPAIPWRKANVKHTSNELYVDIVETLSVTLAPSGRPLAAFANGSILFTAKISGVPDLLLNITTPSGKHTVDTLLESPTFHPCVRLARWKERPGEFSFVPPDGRFMLAGYTVDLLPETDLQAAMNTKNLNLPVSVQMSTSLGVSGTEFEARLILTPPGTSANTSSSSLGSRPAFPHISTGPRGSGRSTPSLFGSSSGSSSAPVLREVVVTIPMPSTVRNISDMRASRGEAIYLPIEHMVEWRLSTKEAAEAGNATLRCAVVGDRNDDDDPVNLGFDAANGGYGDYDEEKDAESGYQAAEDSDTVYTKAQEKDAQAGKSKDEKDAKRIDSNKILMPTSAAVSFSVKGWLASGIKVESLTIDTRRSRGLGDGVKPVKGAKYLTISRKGVETRC